MNREQGVITSGRMRLSISPHTPYSLLLSSMFGEHFHYIFAESNAAVGARVEHVSAGEFVN